MNPAISLDGIYFNWDGNVVLSGLHLSVENGQVLALLGDRIAVRESGRIAQVGSFNELREEPTSAFVRELEKDLNWQEPLRT